jgi:hypothetical protein
MHNTRVRNDPRISVSKLGEYMSAHSGRRRTIVADQKRPKDFIVTWYKEARSTLIEYFTRGCEPQLIEQAIEALAEGPYETERRQQEAELSVEALDVFLEDPELLDLSGLTIRAGSNNTPPLSIAGVNISVAPDLLLEGTHRNGSPFRGTVKIYMVKGHGLDADAGACAATVIRQWTDQFYAEAAKLGSPAHCMVLDVFAQKVFSAPKSFRRRMTQIEAACEEIALRWPTV